MKILGQKRGSLEAINVVRFESTPSGQRRYLLEVRCECGAAFSKWENDFRRTRTPGCPSCRAPINAHPLHSVWYGMHERCYNPHNKQYKYYGARGISIHSRWRRVPGDLMASQRAFKNFCDDVGHRPAGSSIDRINNDGDYEPTNCRWATHQQQNTNKRQRPKKQKPPLMSTSAKSERCSIRSAAVWAKKHEQQLARLPAVEIEL